MSCLRNNLTALHNSTRRSAGQLPRSRFASTVSSTKKSFPSSTWILIGSTITSGALGYAIASNNGSHLDQAVKENDPQVGKYGTADDFVKAVGELRETLSDSPDAVSTDPEDLRIHGFSENDYHPGK
ncbi:D-lactate ferricytochrome c oxidoreductase [Marasmius tenuissimus]|uniref:D-lactate ferricytochrome c oxidoreductase n=1 Tax=Marasmius tenuissimus TaxID=585030 RepID=A0ABR2ZWB8_9AGAR